MGTQQGSWIWYELMSPDPEASKAFYDAVIGWSMTTGHGDTNDYGFITAPDGAMVGGMLRLNAEMQQHGRAGSVISRSKTSMRSSRISRRLAARC